MALENKSSLASRPVKEIYAVSRLVREAKQVLEGSFPLLWVEGEISNLAMPASGHIYFTLKDEAAQVRCAMFRTRNRNLRFTPKNGMQVLLRVRVTLYEGRGEFQLVAEHMEEAGSGALQRAYDALRHRLGEEGLFDTEHKKPLPLFPQTVGIISSPDGAAVHDILSVLNRRFSSVNAILYPVSVQGEQSAKQLKKAVILAEQRKECDVIIISRGGGSLEDLWSFNDEGLARALFKCSIPIISAVGHEVDFTIADFVADVRAPTPSVAAELAVQDSAEWMLKIQSIYRRLNRAIEQILTGHQYDLKYLQQRLPQPLEYIEQQSQRLDKVTSQLEWSWNNVFQNKRQQLDYWSVRLTHPRARLETSHVKLASLEKQLHYKVKEKLDLDAVIFSDLKQRLQVCSPQSYITHQQTKLEGLVKQLDANISQQMIRNKANLAEKVRTLSAVSPLNTLDRGYSITTDVESGILVQDVNSLVEGQMLQVQLQKGIAMCQVAELKLKS